MSFSAAGNPRTYVPQKIKGLFVILWLSLCFLAVKGASTPMVPKETYITSITFDPNTAHPSLAVSEDRMYVESGGVQDVPDNPERFDSTACLLGSPGFTSGKHYWEVKYENQREWAVGVAKGSVERKGYITLTPEEGIWQEGLWWLRRMDTTSQTLPNQPEKIGVFLDYEHGTVSFYMGSKVIRKKASFDGEKVFPFFYVGRGVWLKLIS